MPPEPSGWKPDPLISPVRGAAVARRYSSQRVECHPSIMRGGNPGRGQKPGAEPAESWPLTFWWGREQFLLASRNRHRVGSTPETQTSYVQKNLLCPRGILCPRPADLRSRQPDHQRIHGGQHRAEG